MLRVNIFKCTSESKRKDQEHHILLLLTFCVFILSIVCYNFYHFNSWCILKKHVYFVQSMSSQFTKVIK